MKRSLPVWRRVVAVAGATAQHNLPVTLLTGFLGSGKTTLLRRALTDPAFADTAVVINEVGEIGIDHYLVDLVAGDVVELPSGCLCCAVREDLAQTLRGLIERAHSGAIKPFRRLVVETSGLADPAPILFTFGADAMLDQRLRLARVVTVIDAVTGLATLERFAEAARQAAVADALYVSKTDLAPFNDALAARLAALNPDAEVVHAAAAMDPAAVLFGPAENPHPRPTPPAGEGAVDAAANADPPRLPSPSPAGGGGSGWGLQAAPYAHHTHGIATFTVLLQRPIGALEFATALGGLAMERGYDLLRVKGLVAFADRPERPAVIQAAQHAMTTPEWLDAWPDADRRSRLVFIVHDIPAEEVLDRFAFASPNLLQPTDLREGGDASGRHRGG
jgi:G3E family GTPase